MNSHSPTPSSGDGGISRKTGIRSGGLPYTSERQTKAYLLARDIVRRIQRTSPLISAASQKATGGSTWAQGDRHQRH
ncbi:hypothetical protein BH11PSE13_BH11PSE13_42120 [soil metagenome]